jgi:hypothetical protein
MRNIRWTTHSGSVQVPGPLLLSIRAIFKHRLGDVRPVTVTIQLSDEQAAVLQAQAADEGLTVDAWLQRLVVRHA